MQSENLSATDPSPTRFLMRLPAATSFSSRLGRKLFGLMLTLQGLSAFALITLGVLLTKFGAARQVMRPRIREEIARSGLKLLPMFLFIAAALGFLVIGQSVAALQKVGAISYFGKIMVVVVVRELGPLATALLVLARRGTANVVELGTARALGEVEALEALSIDPVHYLVVPRVIGLALSVFCLTVYLILGVVVSGYLWAFLQNISLTPGVYFRQLAGALSWVDFALLALKTCAFGFIIAIVTCYHGLARPIRLNEVSFATVRAVAQGVVACVAIDALFIVIYLISS